MKKIKFLILLIFLILFPLNVSGTEKIDKDIEERLKKLDETIKKAVSMLKKCRNEASSKLLKEAINIRKRIDSYLKEKVASEKIYFYISKANNLASKSISILIRRGLIPKKLEKLKKIISNYESEVKKSKNKEAEFIFEKLIKSYSLANNSYQEGEYSLSLKYLKTSFNLIKKLKNSLKIREYTLEKISKFSRFIKSRYREIIKSKNKGAVYFLKKAKYLLEKAKSLSREKDYKGSLKILSKVRKSINRAVTLFKGKEIAILDKSDILEEWNYLEKIYKNAENRILRYQIPKVNKILESADKLKKEIFQEIEKGKFKKALDGIYKCNYLISKALFILRKEATAYRSIEEKIKDYENKLSKGEKKVRKSGEEEAFILLWQAKEYLAKAKIEIAKGDTAKALKNLEEIPSLTNKAIHIASSSLKMRKKLDWRITHLERLIYKIEDYLKEDMDKILAKETKDLLWKAKEFKIKADIYSARNEKEKALYHVNEGLKNAQKALLNISRSNILEMEEATQFELIRLSDIILKAEKCVTPLSNHKIRNMLKDAKKMEENAYYYFKKKNYKKTLENIRGACNLAYKVMGIESEEDVERELQRKLKRLDKNLAKAQILRKKFKDKEAEKYLEKAEEIYQDILISFYIAEDTQKAKKEIEEALRYTLLYIEKIREKNPEYLAKKEIEQNRRLIEEAKEKVVNSKNKKAKEILKLSEKYYNLAKEYLESKEYQKIMDNVEASKYFALKAIKLVQ